MKNILVLSAHLDDAAFSVGPLLAEWKTGARITVATIFTQSVANPEGFALACQLDKGLSVSVDYMQIRRNEDRGWAAKIGVQAVHGPFREAPHRGYHSAKTLFESILPTDLVGSELHPWLKGLIASHTQDLVLIPLGIGNHVDHQWVRTIAEGILPNGYLLAYYQDQPYAEKSGSSVADAKPSDHGPWHEFRILLSQNSLQCALTATEAYRTQIPFQFGGIEPMKQLLTHAWGNYLTLFHTAEIPIFVDSLSNSILSK